MSLQHAALQRLQKIMSRAGLDITRRSFYSPIPTDLPESTWGRRSELRGLAFDLDEQMAWVAGLIEPTAAEFQPPIQLDGYCFNYANESFGHGDADLLYGVIRARRPAQIVELGSGNSSVVMRLAIHRNIADGSPCEYRVFDPYPNDLLADGPWRMPMAAVAAENLDESVITNLAAGDILFIDTTHTVKIGGDVVRIVLDLLPLVPVGVLVHIHDVPMPFEYDRALYERGFYWAEMYLVQAFLAFNNAFRVRASLRALFVDRREDFARVAPSIVDGEPVSLWIERVA